MNQKLPEHTRMLSSGVGLSRVRRDDLHFTLLLKLSITDLFCLGQV